MSSQVAAEEKTRIRLRRIKLRDIASSDIVPVNVLIVGPSISRKNACIQDIVRGDSYRAIMTTHQDQWPHHEPIVSTFTDLAEADVRVIENIPGANGAANEIYKLLQDGRMNVIATMDYPIDEQRSHIPKNVASAITHVILLGGVQHVRRVWDDFGALVPKFRDFRQIYLACTDEGNRYSDDFLVISVNPHTTNASEVLGWGSLRRDQVKNITVEFSLLLNKVQTAQMVELPVPEPSAIEEAVTVANTDDIQPPEAEGEADENERDPRECIIC